MVVNQYPDTLLIKRGVETEDDFGYVSITDEQIFGIKGRYEAFNESDFKEFEKLDGKTILADGVFYTQSEMIPNRFEVIEVRDKRHEVLHTYVGQLNKTIYLKELK